MIVSQHYTNSLLKIFRGSDQRVDILIKDYDRRPALLEDTESIRFRLFNLGVQVLDKAVEEIDFCKSHYALTLTQNETGNFRVGSNYTWCMYVFDSTNQTERMLFTNQDYGAHAPAHVIDGLIPEASDPIEITASSMTGDSEYFISSALPGAAQVINPAGAHSLVFDFASYVGTIIIQATLDEDIPLSGEGWSSAKTVEYSSPVTGTTHIPLIGNYNWVRVRVSTTTGFTKITYRNS